MYFLLDFTFHICCFLNLFTFFFMAFLPISYEMSVCWNVFSFCERRTLEIHLSSERHKSSENLKPTTIQKMKAAATYLSVLPQQRRNYLSKYKSKSKWPASPSLSSSARHMESLLRQDFFWYKIQNHIIQIYPWL